MNAPNSAKTPCSIILLAYNEESHIQDLIKSYYHEIYAHLPAGSEFIVYLDKPTDNTLQKVKEIAEECHVTLHEGEQNVGYGKAMKAAILITKNDLVFYSDASGKHIPNDFWALYGEKDTADIISGFRSNRTDALLRRFVSFCQRILVVVLFWVPYHDYNTGFKLIHKDKILSALMSTHHMKQSFSSELLIRAFKQKKSIVSVPVTFKSRSETGGTSFKNLPSIIVHSLKGYILLFKDLLFSK